MTLGAELHSAAGNSLFPRLAPPIEVVFGLKKLFEGLPRQFGALVGLLLIANELFSHTTVIKTTRLKKVLPSGNGDQVGALAFRFKYSVPKSTLNSTQIGRGSDIL